LSLLFGRLGFLRRLLLLISAEKSTTKSTSHLGQVLEEKQYEAMEIKVKKGRTAYFRGLFLLLNLGLLRGFSADGSFDGRGLYSLRSWSLRRSGSSFLRKNAR
jgi:hypothetical protein